MRPMIKACGLVTMAILYVARERPSPVMAMSHWDKDETIVFSPLNRSQLSIWIAWRSMWGPHLKSNGKTSILARQISPPIPSLRLGATPSHKVPPSDYSEPIPNPQLYGWIPEIYPNPQAEPDRCMIAYLQSTCQRLCDPDWVLGGLYLEEIAMVLSNFSYTISHDEHGGWSVIMEQNSRRYLREESITSSSTVKWMQETHPVELGVATVRRMNLPSVLREGAYSTYEDEDDMVNDAAQIFARYIHEQWWSERNEPYGILIFLSIQDRVCFISTGSSIASILPWWRLEHVVGGMKPDLRKLDYGASILGAMHDLEELLQAGPPTMQDRLQDFSARFGVVICFTIFTFFFGAWGEYRDRRKRWQHADTRSRLTKGERESARLLQRDFSTKSCPICLETFSENQQSSNSSPSMKRVDSFGIPVEGNDAKPIKLLRCGHIFDESCWRSWVNSGHGNPFNCPVCRQDIGKSAPNKQTDSTSSHPTYDSVASSRRVTVTSPQPSMWQRGFLGRQQEPVQPQESPTETDSLLGQ